LEEFDYVAVKTIPEALRWLSSQPERTKILAGGTDLLVQLREGHLQTDLVVDIKGIPELNEISFDPLEGLTIGAAVPCYRLCQNEILIKQYPGLLDAISLIGGVQIQGRASLGGNLCNASPAADTIPALVVHDATCTVNGHHGHRKVAMHEFCTGPGTTVLAPDELLVSINLPVPEIHTGSAYLRFIPRNEMDIAVAGAAALLTLEPDHQTIHKAQIALAAVAPTPLWVAEAGEFLAGKIAGAETFQQAAQIAREAAQPINDRRGTVSQRKQLASVLTRRALEKALQRARA
jgi:carbon-monoxide dehydrogenase medium subunit